MGGSISRGASIEKLQLVQERNLTNKWHDQDPVFQDVKVLNMIPAIYAAYQKDDSGWLGPVELHAILSDYIKILQKRTPKLWKNVFFTMIDEIVHRMCREDISLATSIRTQWAEDKETLQFQFAQKIAELRYRLEYDPLWLDLQARQREEAEKATNAKSSVSAPHPLDPERPSIPQQAAGAGTTSAFRKSLNLRTAVRAEPSPSSRAIDKTSSARMGMSGAGHVSTSRVSLSQIGPLKTSESHHAGVGRSTRAPNPSLSGVGMMPPKRITPGARLSASSAFRSPAATGGIGLDSYMAKAGVGFLLETQSAGRGPASKSTHFMSPYGLNSKEAIPYNDQHDTPTIYQAQPPAWWLAMPEDARTAAIAAGRVNAPLPTLTADSRPEVPREDGLLFSALQKLKGKESEFGFPPVILYGQAEPRTCVPRHVFLRAWALVADELAISFVGLSRLLFSSLRTAIAIRAFMKSRRIKLRNMFHEHIRVTNAERMGLEDVQDDAEITQQVASLSVDNQDLGLWSHNLNHSETMPLQDEPRQSLQGHYPQSALQPIYDTPDTAFDDAEPTEEDELKTRVEAAENKYQSPVEDAFDEEEEEEEEEDGEEEAVEAEDGIEANENNAQNIPEQVDVAPTRTSVSIQRQSVTATSSGRPSVAVPQLDLSTIAPGGSISSSQRNSTAAVDALSQIDAQPRASTNRSSLSGANTRGSASSATEANVATAVINNPDEFDEVEDADVTDPSVAADRSQPRGSVRRSSLERTMEPVVNAYLDETSSRHQSIAGMRDSVTSSSARNSVVQESMTVSQNDAPERQSITRRQSMSGRQSITASSNVSGRPSIAELQNPPQDMASRPSLSVAEQANTSGRQSISARQSVSGRQSTTDQSPNLGVRSSFVSSDGREPVEQPEVFMKDRTTIQGNSASQNDSRSPRNSTTMPEIALSRNNSSVARKSGTAQDLLPGSGRNSVASVDYENIVSPRGSANIMSQPTISTEITAPASSNADEGFDPLESNE